MRSDLGLILSSRRPSVKLLRLLGSGGDESRGAVTRSRWAVSFRLSAGKQKAENVAVNHTDFLS